MNFLLITYFFERSDGVGAIRSNSLENFLSANDHNTKVISKQKIETHLKWVLRAAWEILSKGKSYDFVYLSLGPFFTIPILPILCKILGIKIILDFRDPLSQNQIHGYGTLSKSSILKIFTSKIIEKISYSCCREFWVCTPGMYHYYKKLFRDDFKLHLVTNGFDVDIDTLQMSFQNEVIEKFPVTTYICIGKFADYSYSKAKEYLLRIESLQATTPYQILIVGSDKKINSKLSNEFPNINIQILNKMSQIDALKLASQSHYGIVLIRNEDIDFGTKIFEYIGLNLTPYGIFDKNKSFYQYFEKFLIGEYTLEDSRKLYRKKIWQEQLRRLVPSQEH